jgi:hypothetical protein
MDILTMLNEARSFALRWVIPVSIAFCAMQFSPLAAFTILLLVGGRSLVSRALGLDSRDRRAAVAMKKKYTAEQRLAITGLERVVSAVEAQRNFTPGVWVPAGEPWYRAKTPSKPNLGEVAWAFREAEIAVGRFDSNIGAALVRLVNSSYRQQDWRLYEMVVRRYLGICEGTMGRRSVQLIEPLERLWKVCYWGKRFKEAAEIQARAIVLQERKLLMSKNEDEKEMEKLLSMKRTLVAIYTLDKQWGATEELLRDALPAFEKKYGLTSSGPKGIQPIVLWLFHAYFQQGKKAVLEGGTGSDSDDSALRYLRDATALIEKMSSRAVALRDVGRLLVWMGRLSDGAMAFRLANTVIEPDEGKILCQRCGIKHEHRMCDVCYEMIGVDKQWFFCRSCADVDLCRRCHSGGVGEWEDLGRFPKECLEHEFFEVRSDEKEVEIKVEVWIREMCERVAMEIEHGIEERKVGLAERMKVLKYDRISSPELYRKLDSYTDSPGYLLDTIESIYKLDYNSPSAYAKHLWQLDRLFQRTYATHQHKRSPNIAFSTLLSQHSDRSIEQWAFNESEKSLPKPFYLHPNVTLEYSTIMLDAFTKAPFVAASVALVPTIRQDAQNETSAISPDLPVAAIFSIPTVETLMQKKSDAEIAEEAEQALRKLGGFYKSLLAMGKKDLLGASLFDLEQMVDSIGNLEVPAKQGGSTEEAESNFITKMTFSAPAPATKTETGRRTGTYYEFKAGPNPGEKHISDESEKDDQRNFTREYDDLQSCLTDCDSPEEVKMRVRFVTDVARKIQSIHHKSHLPLKLEDVRRHLNTTKPAFECWQLLAHISSTINEGGLKKEAPMRCESKEMADFMMERIVELIQQLGAILPPALAEEKFLDVQLDTMLELPFDAQRNQLQFLLQAFSSRVEHYSQHDPGFPSSIPPALSVPKSAAQQNNTRAFFMTERGFVGLVFQDAQPVTESDSVLLLEGVRMPVVARKKEDGTFDMVGFAHVREFVGGQWWEMEDLCRMRRRQFRFA